MLMAPCDGKQGDLVKKSRKEKDNRNVERTKTFVKQKEKNDKEGERRTPEKRGEP